MYYTHKPLELHMKLNKNELEYIKGMANVMKDADVASELTRIRFDFDVREHVTIDQVRKARYRMGIQKARGRGRCHIKRNKKNE